MKFFPAIILLISLNIYAQDKDTISVDTIQITTDSLSLIRADSLASDTTISTIKDSIVHIDTLYPIYQNPFYSESFFISGRTIDLLDYRYTGNFFPPAGFSFLKDKGLIGQPDELIIYGNGFGGTGYFSDGILYNNRSTNILDLNLMQSEMIDSIEILPLPRGLIYGPDNYLISVNIIEKDFLTPAPYTRIKYYEGPEGEAFVDGMFNTFFMNKFNFMLDITNRKFDGTFINSDFSIWQAKAKLKYFLSNNINLIGLYSLVSSELGFNGGVDVDSILKITNEVNSILYNSPEAPVVYPALRQEVKWDKFKIRALGKFGSFNTDVNFYYHSEIEKYSGSPSNNDETKNYIMGTALRHSYSSSLAEVEVNGVFEQRELNYYYSNTMQGFTRLKNDYNIFSVSPILSFYFLDSTLIPSVFYKYSDIPDYSITNHVSGADVTFKILNNFSLYFGISTLSSTGDQKTSYELGGKIKLSNLSADIRLYRQENNFRSVNYTPFPVLSMLQAFPPEDFNGVSANLLFDFWKIGLEEKFSYNSYTESQVVSSSEIKIHIQSGIFYKDILFNRNLDLKTGFVLKYYDFASKKSAYQLDFTLAGIIQKVAIVYFSWENLFNEQYFIVHYYPMRERGIRFGLSWELFN